MVCLVTITIFPNFKIMICDVQITTCTLRRHGGPWRTTADHGGLYGDGGGPRLTGKVNGASRCPRQKGEVHGGSYSVRGGPQRIVRCLERSTAPRKFHGGSYNIRGGPRRKE